MNQGTRGSAVHETGEVRHVEEALQAVWPPVEQDDTSDELHVLPWWQVVSDAPTATDVVRALEVLDTQPAGPGMWHGHTKARQCADIRDAGDPAVVRDALREAVDAGMIAPAEAVELWPAGEPPAAELDDDGPAGPTGGAGEPSRGPSPRGLAFADWLMEAEVDALTDAGVDVESVIEAAQRWERELLPGLLDRITGRTADRDAARVDDDADGW